MADPGLDALVAALRAAPLNDQLAAAKHARWAHWQSYMNDHGRRNPGGSLTLPAELVEQWDRQINRSFAALAEHDKESNREQVDRYVALIENALRDALRAC